MSQATPYQQALSAPATFRMTGKTYSARNTFLMRNLKAVSGAPAQHHSLFEDGVDKAAELQAMAETGIYPIESIVGERVHRGRLQFRVSWEGNWSIKDKHTWLDANEISDFDIAEFREAELEEQWRQRDETEGVPANEEVLDGRVVCAAAEGDVSKKSSKRKSPRTRRVRADKITIGSTSSIGKSQTHHHIDKARSRATRPKPVPVEDSKAVVTKVTDYFDLEANAPLHDLEDSDDDADCEPISQDELDFYAARSVFGR